MGRALLRFLTRQGRITGSEPLAAGFRLIAIESPHFEGIDWKPGDKIQVSLGSAFVARTFTPIDWDPVAGRTRILAYAHGPGPGREWIRSARIGDSCDLFGPRPSINLGSGTGTRVIFGDETSIGLVHSILHQDPIRTACPILEVNTVDNVREVFAQLHLGRAELFKRTGSEAHLRDIEQRLPMLADKGATFLLTGKASSIQRLRRALKTLGVPANRLVSRVYWAPGKTGLD